MAPHRGALAGEAAGESENAADVFNGSAGSASSDMSDVALSDIDAHASDGSEEIIAHQRLTINNRPALLKSLKSISLDYSAPFTEYQTLTSVTPTDIPDVNDDLQRELAIYKQCIDSVAEARGKLRAEGVPFSRPNDYFAEMVKADEHMDRIHDRMREQAANKKASAEAKKQRDLRKFGKQVQVAKLQERDRAKKRTLDQISILKRKRKSEGVEDAGEGDMFDIALDSTTAKNDKSRFSSGSRKQARGGASDAKRAKRDQKYGYGGKKRFSKSGDAASSADLRGFSAKKMKANPNVKKRLGKSRRAKK